MTMIAEGDYEGRAVSAVLCETKAGREQVAVEFALENNRRITWFGFFGDKVDNGGKTLTERTIESLRAIGWDGDDLTDLSTARGVASLVIGHEEYNGKTTPKVKFVNRLGGGFKPKAMDERKAMSFAERMK